MLTSDQFDRTRRLALRLAGIELEPRHRELLDRRSRRLGVGCGSAGFDSLLHGAEVGDAEARRSLIGLLTTRVTQFFRHPWHFQIAAEQALWTAHGRGRACLWSAAAATGEEPYSLAMALLEVFRGENPPATILATDIDAGALATAQRGVYGEAALSDLEPARRARFFSQAEEPGRWRIAEAARRLVEFREANLTDLAWPVAGRVDVVLCRNVLMYLEASRREAAVERIADLLSPGGLLILDPAEHLGPAARLFSRGANGVFTVLRKTP